MCCVLGKASRFEEALAGLERNTTLGLTRLAGITGVSSFNNAETNDQGEARQNFVVFLVQRGTYPVPLAL